LGRTEIKAEIEQRIQAININITQRVIDESGS